jgi:hypothetical protein
MLPLGGLHGKHAVQRGICVPRQHLLWDQGKPGKPVSEPSGRKRVTDNYKPDVAMQQLGNQVRF